jgi:citrate synthase
MRVFNIYIIFLINFYIILYKGVQRVGKAQMSNDLKEKLERWFDLAPQGVMPLDAAAYVVAFKSKIQKEKWDDQKEQVNAINALNSLCSLMYHADAFSTYKITGAMKPDDHKQLEMERAFLRKHGHNCSGSDDLILSGELSAQYSKIASSSKRHLVIPPYLG